MEGRHEVAERLSAHMDAARRLRAGIERYPEARRGLQACLRHHVARAATLAHEICGRRAVADTTRTRSSTTAPPLTRAWRQNAR